MISPSRQRLPTRSALSGPHLAHEAVPETSMLRLTRFAAAVSSTIAALAAPAQAQQAPATSQARPPSIVLPASPAPKGQPAKSLGGKGAPSGKMLTREELRSCLKRLDDITAGGKDLVQRRTALDAERDALIKSGDELKQMLASIDAKQVEVRAWEGRMRVYAAEVENFNRRTREVEDSPKADRAKLLKAIDADREVLERKRGSLADEEAALVAPFEASVRTYREKAQSRDAVVVDWNARNKALNEAGEQAETARAAWLSECANRPYRDEDEAAIKAGK